ncbi:uncharacterized protein si:dkey-52l18.4 isoform X1 [Astyanax mexicanus]|uniref:Si:dkey-52l18.4 n=1 Tax=Astyanax mexicanus TaxID=7994 RepID=W5JXM0_ASTMX|nr:uncharacterized protein si:dkey-52l18.4 isoform X1 [Astyanax mexicanus]
MPNALLDGCLMIVLVFSCHLQVGVTGCVNRVVATRGTLYVPEGGSTTLQCVVEECGLKDWTGGWRRKVGEHFTPLTPSPQFHLSNYTVSANRTRLLLNIQNLSQSDSGGYNCMVQSLHYTSQGHITYLNVTSGNHVNITESTHRKLSHRILVWIGASLCFPLALGLSCCLASIRLRPPPVPPRFRSSSTARVKPKIEVVYTSVVLKSPRQTKSKSPAEREPTVYTSLNFSVV